MKLVWSFFRKMEAQGWRAITIYQAHKLLMGLKLLYYLNLQTDTIILWKVLDWLSENYLNPAPLMDRYLETINLLLKHHRILIQMVLCWRYVRFSYHLKRLGGLFDGLYRLTREQRFKKKSQKLFLVITKGFKLILKIKHLK